MAKAFLNEPFHIDQRKHRSHVRLYTALVKQYQAGSDFADIEVKALCERAGVSRATFYRHHQQLADVIVVQMLIVIADFERQVDALTQVDFTTTSAIVVAEIQANLELMRLVTWSASEARIQDLFSGTTQKILILRDYPPAHRRFVADFLGGAVLNFARLLATTPVSDTEALMLYRELFPHTLLEQADA
ncbi:hypothetical protein [Lacticaseibacillus sp. GG6-2]